MRERPCSRVSACACVRVMCVMCCNLAAFTHVRRRQHGIKPTHYNRFQFKNISLVGAHSHRRTQIRASPTSGRPPSPVQCVDVDRKSEYYIFTIHVEAAAQQHAHAREQIRRQPKKKEASARNRHFHLAHTHTHTLTHASHSAKTNSIHPKVGHVANPRSRFAFIAFAAALFHSGRV